MSHLIVRDGSAPAKLSRRRWTIGEKLAIVHAAKYSGDPVSLVARRHGMNANLLFNWLQRDRDGTLDRGALSGEAVGAAGFIDVGLIGVEAPGRETPALEIELPCGAKVKVAAGSDAAMLGSILLAVRAAS